MTTSQLTKYVESLTGHPLNRDEGILYGDAKETVATAVVCWMATPDAIQFAGDAGADLLVCHEALFFPYPSQNAARPEGWEMWPVNRARREALDRHHLTAMRIHGSADEICIFDDFAELFELGKPVYEERLVKVYELAPLKLSQLVKRVKRSTGMRHLRVSAGFSDEIIVHRIGLPWGGLGLFVNVTYQQSLIALECDVFIAGESDNYGIRFGQEAGIPLIETSHEISENPGLRHFTEILQERFPDTSFTFYENPCCWGCW